MNEQAHTANKAILSEEANQEISNDSNAEQATPEESRSASGEAQSEHLDFSQMYDMLRERDTTITTLRKEIGELKKSNTTLLLKVNASSSNDASLKSPYEKFIDSMIAR